MNKDDGTKNQKASLLATKKYIAPDIIVVDVEIEQNILASASGIGDLPGMPGHGW